MSDKSLSLIESARGLISAEDHKALAAMSAELRHTFETAQVFRTPTEMVISVLNDLKRPTPDSKYWQSVREQDVFLNELVNLSYEYRRIMINIRQLERSLETETDDLERELIELEIEHKNWQGQQMARTAKHRVRELKNWSEIKSQLEPHLQYGTEDVNAHQLEAMKIRFAEEAKLVNEHTPPADARNILGLFRAALKA